MSKKFYILTLGCQMNKNDSERIAGLCLAMGMEEVKKSDSADLIVVNTCSVRQTAEERIFGYFEDWQKYRLKNPNLVVAITGCMAGRDEDGKLKARLKGVDLFFPTKDLTKLPEWLSQKWGSDFSLGELEDYLLIAPYRVNKFQVFVSIQTGCDNFCTYCVVPYARGREKNRKVSDIIEEIKIAVADGAKEITLLGQVVNHYIAPDKESFSKDNPFAIADDFSALLWEINQISGEFRIHYTAPDPQYFTDAQIESLKLPKQVNFLHLPVQSGDDEILRKMNRKYTAENYIELIKKIRLAKPEIALGTDIIVGFCGETNEQFKRTVDLYKECDFDISYHAMYSERSGTVASKAFKDDVPKEIKKQRWNTLQNLMEEIVLRKNQKYLNQTVRVLVEKCSASGVGSGNSDELKLVEFPCSLDLVGKFVKVKINFASKWILRGVIEN